MKKHIKCLLTATICGMMTLSACGCQYQPPVGEKAPPVAVDRQDFIAGTSSMNNEVVKNLIEEMNQDLNDEEKMKDYTVSYDEEKDTYFVADDQYAIAVKLGRDGKAQFGSYYGGITDGLGTSISKGLNGAITGKNPEVAEKKSEIERKKWLNDIASSDVSDYVNGFSFTRLDDELPDVESPKVPEMNTEIKKPGSEGAGLDLEGLFEMGDMFKNQEGSASSQGTSVSQEPLDETLSSSSSVSSSEEN